MIPFSRYGILADIRPLGRVISENHTSEGTELTLYLSKEVCLSGCIEFVVISEQMLLTVSGEELFSFF